MNTIYSFWISGPLQPVNLLTIRSFQAMGHKFILYAYDVSITNECEVRDARFIMPESEIFYYKRMMGGNPNFKFGGIAERLKARMLHALGGMHVDLDVTCLQPLNFEQEYVFRPHRHGVVANIVKAPVHSEFAARYIELTNTVDENNRDWEKSFRGLQPIVTFLGLQHYIQPEAVLGMDEDKYWKDFRKRGNSPAPEQRAIHHCCAMNEPYEEGSFYHQLLNQYKLL